MIVLTLALAIGASMKIFTLVNGSLLGKLPFGRADRIEISWY